MRGNAYRFPISENKCSVGRGTPSYLELPRCDNAWHVVAQRLAVVEALFKHQGACGKDQDICLLLHCLRREGPQAFVVFPLIVLELLFNNFLECAAFVLLPTGVEFRMRCPHVEPCSRDLDTVLPTGTGDGQIRDSVNHKSKSHQEAVCFNPSAKFVGLERTPHHLRCNRDQILRRIVTPVNRDFKFLRPAEFGYRIAVNRPCSLNDMFFCNRLRDH